MKIYWIKAQAPRRVLALVKHLGLPADFVHLDLMAGALKDPEYARLNPNQKAPTLVDGHKVLWESSAIMAYLCTKAGSDMWPTNAPAEQIEIMRWISWNDCHWSRAVGDFYFEHVVKATFGLGSPNRDALKDKVPILRTYAKVLDDHLATTNGFVACGRLTLADFYLAPMAAEWKRAEMPLEDYPHVVRWLARLDELPAWRSPWPDA
jgi:glutathione S-transferase